MAPIMTSRSPQWDPIKVLNLDLAAIDYSVQCHGLTLKRVRCRNPIGRTWHEEIRQANRILASRPLHQISERDLVPLASTLLCKHQHNGKQDYELAARWWYELGLYMAQGSSFEETKDPVYELKAQLAAAMEQIDAHRKLSVDAATELIKSQTRLASQDSLLASQKALLLSKDAKIAELTRKNEALVMGLSVDVNERDVTIRKLKSNLEKSQAVLNTKSLEHKKEVSEIERSHEVSEQKLRAEISEMSKARRTKESELRDARVTNTILVREKQSQSLKMATLQESVKQLRLNEYFRTVRHQLQIRMWQRHCDGLQADNQTLIRQEKDLQKVAGDFGQELQALQSTLSPLKLENVKKGLHTVFSLRPMRIRALRIST